MYDLSHTAFFGDRERAFKLTPTLIVELERVTGLGIGSLCKRLFAGDFHHANMVETIRLALIGGGTSPQEADALTRTYATDRPLSEAYPLTVSILEALWFGKAAEPVPVPPIDDEPAPEAPVTAEVHAPFLVSAEDRQIQRLRAGTL